MRHVRTTPEEPPAPPLWVRDGSIALALAIGAKLHEVDDLIDEVKLEVDPALPSDTIAMYVRALGRIRSRRREQQEAARR